jgi:hypothetical protein
MAIEVSPQTLANINKKGETEESSHLFYILS